MKTSSKFTVALGWLAAALGAASGASAADSTDTAISSDRINYFHQTAASTLTSPAMPFSFAMYVRGNADNWGPAFYKPGSSGVPQSGTSSDTNTGTLNFPATADSNHGYIFVHDFASDAAMTSFYPIAPTGSGQYGVVFNGTSKPTPTTFTAGLIYGNDVTYPTTTPQVTGADNNATWAGGVLYLSPTGVTTITLNTFSEYSTAGYGAFIGAGIYDNSGGVISDASLNSYHLPMGNSSADPTPINEPAITQVTIDGSWLTAGHSYTLELQYAILGSRPDRANLNSQPVQGFTTYRKLTTISIALQGSSSSSGSEKIKADFNGDGKQDVLWYNSSSGDYAIWLMNGTTISSSATYTAAANWQVVTARDFNGDGKADILWRNSATGAVVLWQMNGTTMTSSTWVYDNGVNWTPVQFGDLNGDGKTDIIWYNSITGEYAIWLMNGASLVSSSSFSLSGWSIESVSDFNGDGKADILWRNATSGGVVLWVMNGTAVSSSTWIYNSGTAWAPAVFADFNADGRTDIGWHNDSTGDNAIWLMNGASLVGSAAYGAVSGWDVVAAKDFNGDGKADLLWRNPSTGSLVVWQMDGTAVTSSGWIYDGGTNWSPNLVGDFNGDGKADILWQDAAGTGYAFWLMNGYSLSSSSAFTLPAGWAPR